MLHVAALADDANIYQAAIETAYQFWRDQKLTGILADELRQLMESEFWILSPAVRNSGAKVPTAPGRSKILVNTQQKFLLVDAEDMIFATIDGGMISIISHELEGSSNYRTLDELEDALASDSFFRAHRSYLVNIHHIKEVVPWFKSSFMLKMNDKKHTEIPISRSQTKRFRELFKI